MANYRINLSRLFPLSCTIPVAEAAGYCHRSGISSSLVCEIVVLDIIFVSDVDLTRFNKIAIQGTPQMAVD